VPNRLRGTAPVFIGLGSIAVVLIIVLIVLLVRRRG
jgi:hypothetical protein